MQIATHLQATQASYIREILAAATADGVISLAGGLPAQDSFPLSLMEQAIIELPQQPELFQYGATAGYPPLLEYLAGHYHLSSSHQVLISTGSQQALDLIARAFLNPGDGVAMEAPSYLGALQVFALARANIISIRQHQDGPDLAALESNFASGKVKVFYAVPDFHNPTGISWSLTTRKQVAQLCRQYNIGLIEDAPYRSLSFSNTSLPMVSSFCPDQAWVLRSYSKVATPGMRIGLVTAPKAWIEPLMKVKQASDLHSSLPMQAVLLKLLSHSQFPMHLEKMCQLYQQRHNILTNALLQYCGDKAHLRTVDGGMFVWLKIPDNNAMAVAKEALTQGVAVVPSDVFYQNPKLAEAALRLNFSHASEENLTIAAQRLGKVLLNRT